MGPTKKSESSSDTDQDNLLSDSDTTARNNKNTKNGIEKSIKTGKSKKQISAFDSSSEDESLDNDKNSKIKSNISSKSRKLSNATSSHDKRPSTKICKKERENVISGEEDSSTKSNKPKPKLSA